MRTAGGALSLWLGGALVAGVGFGAAAALALHEFLDGRLDATTSLALAAILILLAALVWRIAGAIARPVDRLRRDLVIIGRDNPDHPIRLDRDSWLDPLVAAAEQLRRRIQDTEARAASAVAEATTGLEAQKSRLEAILLDLDEGVVVCNLEHQVLLYNAAAAGLVGEHDLGLGRSLFPALTQEPVLHALERRVRSAPRQLPWGGERFVCGTAEGRALLQARLGLVHDADGAVSGYVLTLAEIGQLLTAATQRDELLQAATEGLRRPLANFRAAAETLADNPGLAAAERAAFEQVLLAESRSLSDRLTELERAHRDLGGARWLASEIYSSDLVASLARRLGEASPVRLTATGLPQWLVGDSLSLLVLLAHLAEQIHRHAAVADIDIAFTPSDHRIYVELLWTGRPIAASMLEEWLDEPLHGGLGPLTARAVLQRYGSDAWSEAGPRGTALLRVPLASSEGVALPTRRALRPQRPEFYDFNLLHQPLATGPAFDRPLRQLTYIVFDVETTGLRPTAGDEVVSLAAVRVVNGRILTMESVEWLINPGRAIPEESVRFHGITDAMVKDKPPLAVVLPEFRRLARDAVLVAHNAAFDLTFLNRASGEGADGFPNPVLDTLLLSAFLDNEEADHSLDAITARLGLAIENRHNALGDSLATAAILLRFIDRLEARGLTTLGAVTNALNMAGQLRARQQQLEGRENVFGSA